MKIKDRGFTLIELIVVIIIISILVLFASPKFIKYILEAKLAHIKNDTATLSSILESERLWTKDIKETNGWLKNITHNTGISKDNTTLDNINQGIGWQINPEFVKKHLNTRLDPEKFYYNKEGRFVFYAEDGEAVEEVNRESAANKVFLQYRLPGGRYMREWDRIPYSLIVEPDTDDKFLVKKIVIKTDNQRGTQMFIGSDKNSHYSEEYLGVSDSNIKINSIDELSDIVKITYPSYDNERDIRNDVRVEAMQELVTNGFEKKDWNREYNIFDSYLINKIEIDNVDRYYNTNRNFEMESSFGRALYLEEDLTSTSPWYDRPGWDLCDDEDGEDAKVCKNQYRLSRFKRLEVPYLSFEIHVEYLDGEKEVVFKDIRDMQIPGVSSNPEIWELFEFDTEGRYKKIPELQGNEWEIKLEQANEFWKWAED